MIYCSQCQKPSSGQSSKCPHCGAKLPSKTAARPRKTNPPKRVQLTALQLTKQPVVRKKTAAAKKSNSKPAASQTPKSPKVRLRLGEILIAAGILSFEQLELALNEQKQTGQMLGAILVEQGAITELQLVQALSHQADVRWIDLDKMEISDAVANAIPARLAESYLMFPIDVRASEDGSKFLFLAMDNPSNLTAVYAAQAASGMAIEPLLAAPSAIRKRIQQLTGAGSDSPVPDAKNQVDPNPSDDVQLGPDINISPSVVAATEPKATKKRSTPPKATKPTQLPPELTLLDGVKIPWVGKAGSGLVQPQGSNAVLDQLKKSLGQKASTTKVQKTVVALVELLVNKGLILPAELIEQLKKK